MSGESFASKISGKIGQVNAEAAERGHSCPQQGALQEMRWNLFQRQ
jgi:hypothetical protein